MKLSLVLLAGLLAVSTLLAAPPNIIVILADDLGWGDLGCYGHPNLRTPNIDRIAKERPLFTQFYVNGSVCSPSRTAFMTGQFPARHKVHSAIGGKEQNATLAIADWLDLKVPTVASLLQKSGYATAHFGKWHLGMDWVDGKPGSEKEVPLGAKMTGGPNALGFDYFYGFTHARNIGTVIEQDRVCAQVAAKPHQTFVDVR